MYPVIHLAYHLMQMLLDPPVLEIHHSHLDHTHQSGHNRHLAHDHRFHPVTYKRPPLDTEVYVTVLNPSLCSMCGHEHRRYRLHVSSLFYRDALGSQTNTPSSCTALIAVPSRTPAASTELEQ